MDLTLKDLKSSERLRIVFYKNDIDIFRTQLVIGSLKVIDYIDNFQYGKQQYIIRDNKEINIYI